MPRFKRKVLQPEPRDDGLDVFTVSQANEFRAVARNAFAEMGLEVEIRSDHAVDSAGRQFGFWNIATQCADAPRRDWPGLVSAHARRVLESMDGPDPFQDLDRGEAARRTYARLYAAESLLSPELFPHREFAPGIVEALALDLPETVAVFSHENAATLGGFDALRAAGVANLHTLPVERLETIQAAEGSQFTALMGDSVYTASRALLLPALATQLTGEEVSGHGWLFSVPNRHQVVWHVIRDLSIVHAVNGMAHFTVLGFSDAPGPVSPHVYWWNGSQYEQLTHVDDRGNIAVRAGPAFMDMLNQLDPRS
jgi:hypothetical protein